MTSHLVVSYTLVYYAFHPRALPVDSTLLVAHDPPLFIEFQIDPYLVTCFLLDCGSGLNVVSYKNLLNPHYTNNDMQVS